MNRALAVVEATDSAKALVREAGELAGGVDAELVLLHVTRREEYNESRDAMAAIPDIDVEYTVDRALDGARQFARDIGNDVLDGVDVDWKPAAALGDKDDTVVDEAHERDCDHVFIAGRKRSPTGKALFGDAVQNVVLDFDGAVTVITE